MSTSATDIVQSYTGNASTTVFTFPAKFLDNDHLKVYLDGVAQTSGFTVSGGGSASGGSVTFTSAPASGVEVVIVNEPPLTQLLDLTFNGKMPSTSLENAYDKLTMLCQLLDKRTDQSLKFPIYDTASLPTDLTLANRQGKLLGFDTSSNAQVELVSRAQATYQSGDRMVFASVSALTTEASITSVSSGDVVLLTGYYAAGDFGSPIELIVEASTGGVKSHTLADGRYANLYADVAYSGWFGLDGTLTTDQKTNFNSFIGCGAKQLVLTSGTYHLGGASTTASDITLTGEGATLKAHSSLDGTTTPMWTSTGNRLKVSRINFDGNVANVTTGGSLTAPGRLDISGTHIQIEDNDFSNFLGTAIRLTGTVENVNISRNKFNTCGSASVMGRAVYADNLNSGAKRITISDNKCYDTSGFAIFSPADGLTDDVNITFNRLVLRGEIAYSGMNARVIGNYVDLEHTPFNPSFPNAILGISMDYGLGCTVSNNFVTGFRQIGIEIVGKEANHNEAIEALPSDLLTGGTVTTGKRYRVEDFIAGDDFSNIATVNNRYCRFTATGTTPTTWSNGTKVEKVSDRTTQTSGTLTIGEIYRVLQFETGDDFDNVANINVDGSVFKATGTTPTTWTNSSEVVAWSDLWKMPSIVTNNTVVNNETVANLAVMDTFGIQVGNEFCAGTIIQGNTLEQCGISIYGYDDAEANLDPSLDDDFLRDVIVSNNKMSDHPGADFAILTLDKAMNTVIEGNVMRKLSTVTTGNAAFAINSLDSHNTIISDNTFYDVPTIAREIIPTSSETDLDKFPNGLRVVGNRVYNAGGAISFKRPVGNEGVSGRKAGIVIVKDNLHPRSEAGCRPAIIGTNGWDTTVVASGVVTEKSGYLELDGTASGAEAQARTKFSSLFGDENGQREEFTIGRNWQIDFDVHFADGLTANTDDYSRVIFGKLDTDTTIGLVASYYQFGFELRGREVYGFFHDGTSATYTSLLTTLPSNQTSRTSLSIQSGGGSSPALHFGVSDGASQKNYWLGSLFNLATSSIYDGVGGVNMGAGVHVEVDSTGVGGVFCVGPIHISDYSVS